MSIILSYISVLFRSLPYVLLVYVIAKLLAVLSQRRQLHAAIGKIPGPPPRWPLIGNLDLFWDSNKGLNFSKYCCNFSRMLFVRL